MILLLATACGLIVANVYYSQPLIGPISAELGLSPEAAGIIVTMTQIGYGLGLLLIVPLGDLIENRRLALTVIGLGILACFALPFSVHPTQFLAASLVLGLGSVTVQILIPYAAHLAPEASRGRVVGTVTTGLTIGIMLARAFSSFVASVSSWHVVYLISGVAMIVLAIVLRWKLPRRTPAGRLSYLELLRSMGRLVLTTPLLRRRALYQSFMFASFSLFWTTVPLLLAGRTFQLSQAGIALFALAGAAGAIAAPLGGHLADRGYSRAATGAAIAMAAIAFGLSYVGGAFPGIGIAVLVAAAVVLDFGVQANLVLGYRALFTLGAEHRSRLNGVYMATFFAAGAAGSAIGAWAFAKGGWTLTSCIGLGLCLAGLICFATERSQGAGEEPV